MTIEEAISQLEDLKKDDVEALQMAIDVLRGLNTDHNSTGSTMERYTRVLETGMICPIHGVGKALKQLAAYENTGFTPEQIENLKKELHFTGKYWHICLPTK